MKVSIMKFQIVENEHIKVGNTTITFKINDIVRMLSVKDGKNSEYFGLVHYLPYPDSLANSALRKFGIKPKDFYDKISIAFLIDEISGNSICYHLEKVVTPKNRTEIYVKNKEWIKLKKNDDGEFYY